MNKLLVGAGLSLATIFGMLGPAADAAVVYDSIELGPYTSAQAAAMPALSVSPGDQLYLQVENYSAEPITFQISNLGVNQVIPANSIEVVRVDSATVAAANLMPGQQLAYSAVGADGQTLASGMITNETIAYDATASSTVLVFEDDEEPTYIGEDTGEVESSAAVRGFW